MIGYCDICTYFHETTDEKQRAKECGKVRIAAVTYHRTRNMRGERTLGAIWENGEEFDNQSFNTHAQWRKNLERSNQVQEGYVSTEEAKQQLQPICRRCKERHGISPEEIAVECAAVQSVMYDYEEIRVMGKPPRRVVRSIDFKNALLADQDLSAAIEAVKELSRVIDKSVGIDPTESKE